MISLFYKVTPFLLTPAKGADTMLWLAGAPKETVTTGGYYVKRQLKRPAAAAADPATAGALWEASVAATGL
jgi:hypothetical protein